MKIFATFCIFLVLTNQLYLKKGFEDNVSPIERLRKVIIFKYNKILTFINMN